MTDLATLTAILYAARLQRRVPESDAEKRRTITDALADARLIVAVVGEAPPDTLAAALAGAWNERKPAGDLREEALKALAVWEAEFEKSATPEQKASMAKRDAERQRRLEEHAEIRRTITASLDALDDAKQPLALTETDSPVTLPEPEQPPPSPGTIGRIADAKATRRRGQSGVRPATEA
jgi:hypothetical protein